MATCTFAVGTADTGATPNTSGAFTPSANDLLVAFVVASDTTQATATLTNSAGLTFTQFLRATYRTSADSVYGFVSDALVSSATSQTVDFDTASDAATGTIIFVFRVSGMTRTGLSAVRQSGKGDNGAAFANPSASFSGAALTGNPVLGCVGNSTSPGTISPTVTPGFTEPAGGDLGYSTPTTGGEVQFINSGFTSSTLTWGGNSASAWGALIVELDTSAAATYTPPKRHMQAILAQ